MTHNNRSSKSKYFKTKFFQHEKSWSQDWKGSLILHCKREWYFYCKKEYQRNKVAIVRYVPSTRKNLIFVGFVVDDGNIAILFNWHYWILDKNDYHNVVAVGYWDPSNSLYSFMQQFQANIAYSEDTMTLWHKSIDIWATTVFTICLMRPKFSAYLPSLSNSYLQNISSKSRTRRQNPTFKSWVYFLWRTNHSIIFQTLKCWLRMK